jgi:glycosyltransferase involved in cell wall biosynthesis
MDTNLDSVDPQMRIKNFCEADVVLMYQPVGDQPLHNQRMAQSITPSLQEGKGWKYPPTFIYETDDNLFNVNPHNMAFKNLGVKDHQGNLIPPGQTIGCVQEGEKKVLWVDGQNDFDLMRNRHNIDTAKHLMELADCVTTTTPRNAEAVKANANVRRTAVFPNLVRFDHYPQVDVRQNGEVKILWQGGQAHYEDWYPLREALGRITEKYPQVHWIIWGQMFHWATELIPAHRYTYIPWKDYREYKVWLATFGHQISLAPLEDNHFNRSRSAIKFYEASVLKNPAATLAQATGPYLDEIVDGETGLLFKTPQEFEENLSLLIECEDERKRLGKNAKDWVSEHRDAFKHVPRWVSFLEELRAEQPRERPHMPQNEWEDFMKRMEAEQKAAAESAKAAEAAKAGASG